jgi:hypothetical protein
VESPVALPQFSNRGHGLAADDCGRIWVGDLRGFWAVDVATHAPAHDLIPFAMRVVSPVVAP